MNSAKSGSHDACPLRKASKASRRAGRALFSKAANARASRGRLYSITGPKSTLRSGNCGRFFSSAALSSPSSHSRSRLTSSGLPAKAEKHWYGESP